MAITAGEIILELVLLGTYLALLMAHGSSATDDPKVGYTGLAMGLIILVSLVLLSTYYPFTRPVLGICWGTQKPWLYAVLCGTLYVIHMYFGYLAFRSGMSAQGQAVAAPLLIGGWIITASTALLGRYCLRKWKGELGAPYFRKGDG